MTSGVFRIGIAATALALMANTLATLVWAETRRDAVAQADPAPAPVPAEPQQTSASFGDWVVRCDRPAPTPPGANKRVCEAAQSLIIKGQPGPIAQIAFGRPASDKGGDALSLTVLLPVSIAFDKPPTLAGSDDTKAVSLTFRRCVPGGCLADAKLEAALIKDLRGAQKPGRLTFTDAAERTIALPVSYHGLAQALDDLAKEATKDAAKDSAIR